MHAVVNGTTISQNLSAKPLCPIWEAVQEDYRSGHSQNNLVFSQALNQKKKTNKQPQNKIKQKSGCMAPGKIPVFNLQYNTNKKQTAPTVLGSPSYYFCRVLLKCVTNLSLCLPSCL